MITINEHIANKEYELIIKDNNRLINGILEEKKFSFMILIGIIGLIIGTLIQNMPYSTEFIIGVYFFVLIQNQKTIDQYIDIYMNYENNKNELIKIFATLSKDHYRAMFIKSFFILGFYFIPSLSEFSLIYCLIHLVNNFYYTIFNKKYATYSLIYLFRRVDMYFDNHIYKNMIDSKFNKFFN